MEKKYRIRKLDWMDFDYGWKNGSYAEMGMYYASIRANADGTVRWSIRLHTTVIASGVEKTDAEARSNCEQAWVDFLEKVFLEVIV